MHTAALSVTQLHRPQAADFPRPAGLAKLEHLLFAIRPDDHDVTTDPSRAGTYAAHAPRTPSPLPPRALPQPDDPPLPPSPAEPAGLILPFPLPLAAVAPAPTLLIATAGANHHPPAPPLAAAPALDPPLTGPVLIILAE